MFLAFAFALTACGGGGDSGGNTQLSSGQPTIRYVGTFDPNCTSCSSMPGFGSLVIEPTKGTSTIGSRAIAKVELSVDHTPVQTILAPNSSNVAGLATYVFTFPHATISTPAITHSCLPTIDLEITVTDIGGYAFKKYLSSCHFEVFGAFSDYGQNLVTYSANATALARMDFSRSSLTGYQDSGSQIISASSTLLPLMASYSDSLRMFGTFDQNAVDGSVISVSITNQAGELASSTLEKNDVIQTTSFLECCGTNSAPASSLSGTSRTVTLELYGVRYGVQTDGMVNPFSFYYRVYDPLAGTLVSEFRGTGSGYMAIPVTLMTGHELRLEASPMVAGTFVRISVRDNAIPGSSSLAEAETNRPNFPAILKLYCCRG